MLGWHFAVRGVNSALVNLFPLPLRIPPLNFMCRSEFRAPELQDFATSVATARTMPRTSLDILLPNRCRGSCGGSGPKSPKSVTRLHALCSSTVREATHAKSTLSVVLRLVSELRAETRSRKLLHCVRGPWASFELLGAGIGRRYARPTSPRRTHLTTLVESSRGDAAPM